MEKATRRWLGLLPRGVEGGPGTAAGNWSRRKDDSHCDRGRHGDDRIQEEERVSEEKVLRPNVRPPSSTEDVTYAVCEPGPTPPPDPS